MVDSICDGEVSGIDRTRKAGEIGKVSKVGTRRRRFPLIVAALAYSFVSFLSLTSLRRRRSPLPFLGEGGGEG